MFGYIAVLNTIGQQCANASVTENRHSNTFVVSSFLGLTVRCSNVALIANIELGDSEKERKNGREEEEEWLVCCENPQNRPEISSCDQSSISSIVDQRNLQKPIQMR